MLLPLCRKLIHTEHDDRCAHYPSEVLQISTTFITARLLASAKIQVDLPHLQNRSFPGAQT